MKKQVLLALAALALSGAAAAQGYGVVSAGVSKVDIDCAGAARCDTSDTAFKLLGGYKFNPNFAIEGGYMSFGKAKVRDPLLDLDVTVNGFGIGGAFHQDLSADWNFVARLGLAQMKTKLSIPGTGSDSDSNAALYGGLGIGYKLNKQMSVDASFDFSKGKYNKNGVDLGSANVNAFSIGLTFAF